MNFDTIFAAIAVADIDRSSAWYARLFGRDRDERPMKEAAEWFLVEGGAIQLVLDKQRAGKSMATLGVVDIEAVVSELKARGIEASATKPGDGPFRLAQLKDPDGNLLTFAQDQRKSPAR
jgi:glyoxylase I family protein